MQVTDLIRYNHIVRGLYLDAMAKLPWSEVVADKGLSFDCMRDVFLHLTLFEDRWVGYAGWGKSVSASPPDFAVYTDFESLKKYMLEVQAQTEAYLARLSPEELNRQIDVPWGRAPNTKVSVEAWLTMLIPEDLIHCGELSAAFWQMGLEAPYWGFWRFKLANPSAGGGVHVEDFIRYNHVLRGRYFDALAKLPWSEVVAGKGLSFDSMRDVFLHLTLVEDRWISYIIPGRIKQWVDPDFNSFTDPESLRKYADGVQSRTEAYLGRLTDEELKLQVTVYWGGKPTDIVVEKGLTHMVIEDLIHYGELSAALWQMGQEAPYTGFWRFISKPHSTSFEDKKPA